jgi:signal transduction histidine kinase
MSAFCDLAEAGAPLSGAASARGWWSVGCKCEWRYRIALLSMAGLDLLLSGLFLTMSGHVGAIMLRLPEIVSVLVVANLIGGHRLFRPIRLFLDGRGDAAAAVARLARLSVLSGYWALAIAAPFSTSSFLVTPFVIYGLPAEPAIVAILVARALAWVVLLPYVAYFLIHEQTRRLRILFWEKYAIMVPAGAGRLGTKLALIVRGGAFVPGLSIAVTILLVPPISPLTGQPREVIIMVALLGTGVALSVAFWAMHRSISESLGALTRGMEAIRAGDLTTRLTIQTDDELGRLSEGFNALSRALAEGAEAVARAEAGRAQSAARFHEAQKQSALGRLAAGVAHDFNNILAIVMGYAAVAQRRMNPEDPNRARLGEVLNAAERGKHLIAQILAFTRQGAARHARFDVTACVAQSAEWLGAAIGPGVRMETALCAQALTVDGDATGVHQVVANLCVNGAQAMKADGGVLRIALERIYIDGGRAEGLTRRIAANAPAVVVDDCDPSAPRCWVGLLRPGAHARISVRDEGAGMDAEMLGHIFEPYFTTKPVGEGTGLGLAAVLGVVTAHDGAIALTSSPGAGTRFEVFIPLVPEEGGPEIGANRGV